MGRTRIFLRANAFEYLERLHLRAKICSATYLQRRWRARQAARSVRRGGAGGGRRRASQTCIETMLYFTELTRCRILTVVSATARLQRRARVFLEVTRRKRILRAFRKFQARFRKFLARKRAAVRIQTRMRMFLARRIVNLLRQDRRNKAAALRIQTAIRKRLARKKLLHLRDCQKVTSPPSLRPFPALTPSCLSICLSAVRLPNPNGRPTIHRSCPCGSPEKRDSGCQESGRSPGASRPSLPPIIPHFTSSSL
jgi:hypothetical protein